MRGNSFGNFLTLTTFGESHGVALGAIIDGCPAGVPLSIEDFQIDLLKRRPGQNEIVTSRDEKDQPELLSGVFEGKTIGTPICVIVRNEDARSSDYEPNFFRAGHADRTWQEKFGNRDYRGGGRSSGRETIGRVIGATVAKKMLAATGIKVIGFTKQIGNLVCHDPVIDEQKIASSKVRCPDEKLSEEMVALLAKCKQEGDSRGGIAQIRISGVQAGLGEPVFSKAKSKFAAAFMSVGAVIGTTLGDGEKAATLPGKEFHTGVSGEGEEAGVSSSAFGIQGGITNGEEIVFDVIFKPASTVGKKAQEGRHDPCIIPRAIPVLEAMAWLVIADLWLASRLDRLSQSETT